MRLKCGRTLMSSRAPTANPWRHAPWRKVRSTCRTLHELPEWARYAFVWAMKLLLYLGAANRGFKARESWVMALLVWPPTQPYCCSAMCFVCHNKSPRQHSGGGVFDELEPPSVGGWRRRTETVTFDISYIHSLYWQWPLSPTKQPCVM